MIEKVINGSIQFKPEFIPLDMINQARNKETRILFDINALASSSRVHVRSYLLPPSEDCQDVDMSYIKNMRAIDDIIDLENNPEIEKACFKDLIRQLLRIDPNERIGLRAALEHPFFDSSYDREYDFLFDKVEKTFEGQKNNN